MSKDFAAQRIRNLSAFRAVKDALFPKTGGTEIKTLIETFKYPRHGPGQLWEAVRDRVVAGGSTVLMGRPVVKIRHETGSSGASRPPAARVHGRALLLHDAPGRVVGALDPAPPPARARRRAVAQAIETS